MHRLLLNDLVLLYQLRQFTPAIIPHSVIEEDQAAPSDKEEESGILPQSEVKLAENISEAEKLACGESEGN